MSTFWTVVIVVGSAVAGWVLYMCIWAYALGGAFGTAVAHAKRSSSSASGEPHG